MPNLDTGRRPGNPLNETNFAVVVQAFRVSL
jgi:hypothetical protein